MNDVIDRAWMDTALRAARPRAIGALLQASASRWACGVAVTAAQAATRLR